MNETNKNFISIVFSLSVIALAMMVAHRFFLPLAWAAVMCIATWPLYQRVLPALGNRPIPAALLMTVAAVALFVVPAAIGLWQASRQAPAMAAYVAEANSKGLAPPELLHSLPWVGGYLHDWWEATLAQPHGLAHLISSSHFARFQSASDILKTLGAILAHRVFDFGFAFLCLFFFYKDGRTLQRQITAIGGRNIGRRRWQRYARSVPVAVRATVNGLVLVGLGEGILIGVGYAVAGLSSPALWGALTGILAIIPFGAPVAYGAAAIVLAADGQNAAALGVAAWGSVVLFVADHFIRPILIGNATRLPFLAVLFGIFGGIEVFGLVGLFLGPVVMVLFVVLWEESEQMEQARDPE